MTNVPGKRWQEIAPHDAEALTAGQDGITAPLNEYGKRCHWPWWPQQYMMERECECPHCGGQVITGKQHPDFSEPWQPVLADRQEQVATRDDIPPGCSCLWFQSKTWPTVARAWHHHPCPVHGRRTTAADADDHMAED
jgi:hypothetical protein